MDISHTESLTCCRKWTSLRMFPWWPGARKTSFLKGPSLFNLSSITCKYICTFRYLPSRRRSNFATFCGEDQTGSFAGDALHTAQIWSELSRRGHTQFSPNTIIGFVSHPHPRHRATDPQGPDSMGVWMIH